MVKSHFFGGHSDFRDIARKGTTIRAIRLFMEQSHSSTPDTAVKRFFESAPAWTTLILALGVLIHEARESFKRTLLKKMVHNDIAQIDDNVDLFLRARTIGPDEETLYAYSALDSLKGAQKRMWSLCRAQSDVFQGKDAESKELKRKREDLDGKIEWSIQQVEEHLHIGTPHELKRPQSQARPTSPAQTRASIGSGGSSRSAKNPQSVLPSETAMSVLAKNVQ